MDQGASFWSLEVKREWHKARITTCYNAMSDHFLLQRRLLPERRPSSCEEWRLFNGNLCSGTLLLARSTWLLGGLLFALSLGHGFLAVGIGSITCATHQEKDESFWYCVLIGNQGKFKGLQPRRLTRRIIAVLAVDSAGGWSSWRELVDHICGGKHIPIATCHAVVGRDRTTDASLIDWAMSLSFFCTASS